MATSYEKKKGTKKKKEVAPTVSKMKLVGKPKRSRLKQRRDLGGWIAKKWVGSMGGKPSDCKKNWVGGVKGTGSFRGSEIE